MAKKQIVTNKSWIDKQQNFITISEVEFAVRLAFHPASCDDMKLILAYAKLWAKLKILQNKIVPRYHASIWNQKSAMEDVRATWIKLKIAQGWWLNANSALEDWRARFNNKTPILVMNDLIEELLRIAYDIEEDES